MKIQFQQISTLSIIAVLSIAGLTAFAGNSEPNELSEFLFIVDTTNDEVILSCKLGCAWEELIFSSSSIKNYQAVDQYGMAEENRNNIDDNSDLSEFIFKIRKTKDGISLKGEKGSVWTSLTFNCPAFRCGQAVNQYGMTNQESK